MKKAELNRFLMDKTEIYKKISEIIGYSSLPEYEGLIDETECKWYLSGDTLFLDHDNSDDIDDCYQYTISSYSAKGEKFFFGESDGLTYVMTHDDEGEVEDTSIFILNNDLIIEN